MGSFLTDGWSDARLLHAATLAPLLLALVVAAVVDWRTRRLPNWLTLSILAGGVYRACALHLLGLTEIAGGFGPLGMVGGVLMGVAVGVPLWVIGARGAGDAKLYMAAGAWTGWHGVLVLFAAEAVIGAAIVLSRAAATGRLWRLLHNTGVLAVTLLHLDRLGLATARAAGERYTIYGEVQDEGDDSPRFTSVARPLPHAVPFLLAAVAALLFGWL